MKKSLVAAMFAVMMISLAGCGTEVKTVETETTEVVSVLWSSFFVTLVAKKYHDSVMLSSALHEGWHNC